MTDCEHTITRASLCVSCGVRVYAVHDKPCSECRHSERLIDGWICGAKLMAISADMRVTYKIGAAAARDGLCFEAPNA